jgi:hypothetical protein
MYLMLPISGIPHLTIATPRSPYALFQSSRSEHHRILNYSDTLHVYDVRFFIKILILHSVRVEPDLFFRCHIQYVVRLQPGHLIRFAGQQSFRFPKFDENTQIFNEIRDTNLVDLV